MTIKNFLPFFAFTLFSLPLAFGVGEKMDLPVTVSVKQVGEASLKTFNLIPVEISIANNGLEELRFDQFESFSNISLKNSERVKSLMRRFMLLWPSYTVKYGLGTLAFGLGFAGIFADFYYGMHNVPILCVTSPCPYSYNDPYLYGRSVFFLSLASSIAAVSKGIKIPSCSDSQSICYLKSGETKIIKGYVSKINMEKITTGQITPNVVLG